MAAAEQLFTIAHISDLHFPLPPGATCRQLANKRILSYLSWHHKRKHEHRQEVLDALLAHLRRVQPDHFCVTGDLVNLTLPAEVDRATAWLAGLAGEQRISLIPGNHDALVPGSLDYALRHWQRWMRDDDGRVGFPYLHRRGPVNIVGVSTAVATPPALSLGWIGKRQLARIEALLRTIEAERRPCLLLIHHPPHAHACSVRRGLLDWRKLHQLLQRQPVTAVLFGHLHYPIRAELPGRDRPIPALGTASGSAAGAYKAVAHYHLLKLYTACADWRLRVEHYDYDPSAGEFKLRDHEEPVACSGGSG